MATTGRLIGTSRGGWPRRGQASIAAAVRNLPSKQYVVVNRRLHTSLAMLGSDEFGGHFESSPDHHMHRLWGARMELVSKQLFQLFPTCLFTGKLSDIG